ncbi:hypothetical protein DFP73DRAFT_561037 [Morchella snyderi]|nr:hypothetical protein DFP73DRAFT_561037 [Morchella snyderi]
MKGRIPVRSSWILWQNWSQCSRTPNQLLPRMLAPAFSLIFFDYRVRPDYERFPWSPNWSAEEMLDVPKLLKMNLNNLVKGKYDTTPVGSCRVRIDQRIVACKLAHFEKYPVFDPERRSTPPLQKPAANLDRPLPLITYSGMDLSVEVEERRADAQKGGVRHLCITGKADWAFGHGNRKESGTGTVLIAVGAQNPAMLGQARNQLLAYLAIMRQLRFQENKMNEYVKGFYSDGRRYCVISISHDNYVYESKTYDC